MMRKLLQQIPWIYLLPVAVLIGVMPVTPVPHLFEKLQLLVNGQLSRPIDILDLVMHGGPLLLVFAKLLAGNTTADAKKGSQ